MGCGSSTPAQVPTVRPAAGSTTATERTPPPAPSGSAAASHPRPAQPETEPTTRGGETESKSPEPAFTPASAEQNGQAGASDGATSGAATGTCARSCRDARAGDIAVMLLDVTRVVPVLILSEIIAVAISVRHVHRRREHATCRRGVSNATRLDRASLKKQATVLESQALTGMFPCT